jgi:hypothetical protein
MLAKPFKGPRRIRCRFGPQDFSSYFITNLMLEIMTHLLVVNVRETIVLDGVTATDKTTIQ